MGKRWWRCVTTGVAVCVLTMPASAGAADPVGALAPLGTETLGVPGPATHVFVDNYRNFRFTGFWVLPSSADRAVLCYSPTGTPTSPATAASCSAPGTYYAVLMPGAASSVDPPVPLERFAVFSLDSATGTYGPPAPYRGEVPPPFPPVNLDSAGVSATSLDLRWDLSNPTMSDEPYLGLGGTTDWVVSRARGETPPWDVPADRVTTTTVPADPDGGTAVLRVSNLAKDTDYTFAVRGRDAEGNLSDWSEALTTAARAPGMYLVHDETTRRGWRVQRSPRSGRADQGSLAVQPSGRANLVFRSSDDPRHTVRADGGWRVLESRRAGTQGLTSSPDGTLAAASGGCVTVKPPAGRWRVARCLSDSQPANLSDPVLDARGRLHIVGEVRAEDGGVRLVYATNRGGRWRTRTLAGGILPTLTYDRARDELLLLRTNGAGDQIRVARTSPGARSFGSRWTWTLPSGTASSGDQATARGGRLTIVAGTSDGIVLATSTTSGRDRGVSRVLDGSGGRVAALSRSRVLVAWTTARGVRTAEHRYRRGSETWLLSAPHRRTFSAYDRLLDADVDGRGRSYLMVHRSKAETVRRVVTRVE